jgi:hypothetical protein
LTGQRWGGRRGRLVLASVCLGVLAVSGVALWMHGRGGGRPLGSPVPIGVLSPNYGALSFRDDVPIGRDPFAAGGARISLDTAARISGFTILLPPGRRPRHVWFDAGSGATVVIDYPRGRMRIAEQDIHGCCSVDVSSLTSLRREAAVKQGSRVTTITGYPTLVAPAGVFAKSRYLQVSRPATEVIVVAPPSVRTAAMERLVASLRPYRLQDGR